jgi:hypothetical protein
MLFIYQYIKHDIERLQECLDHLFLEVWCKANVCTNYDILLLHPLLQDIIREIYYDAKVPYGEYLYEPIERVYAIFQQLDNSSKSKLAWIYLENNCIEFLCNREDGYSATTYQELSSYDENLPDLLKDFYEKLYTKVLSLDIVKKKIGKLEDHYQEFVKVNDEGKCPFCGINSIKGIYHSRREAYDHYLPKALYPFNSVNFRNLAPMCHECNSSYKLSKDPINARPKKNPLKNDLGVKRKSFFTYSTMSNDIGFSINISNTDMNTLSVNDIQLTFSNAIISEEIETWKDIFGIEERYKAKCLERNDGKYWFEQATDEYINAQVDLGAGFTKQQWVTYLINAARRKPFAEGNFIKAEFLEAFRNNGVI